MPLEAKKQDRENSQSLVRRFSTKMKKSGILISARKNRFFGKPKSKQMKKRSALRREVLRKEYKKKEKLGKLK